MVCVYHDMMCQSMLSIWSVYLTIYIAHVVRVYHAISIYAVHMVSMYPHVLPMWSVCLIICRIHIAHIIKKPLFGIILNKSMTQNTYSHTRTVPLLSLDASLPSESTTNARTLRAWPRSTRINVPLTVSQTRTVPS